MADENLTEQENMLVSPEAQSEEKRKKAPEPIKQEENFPEDDEAATDKSAQEEMGKLYEQSMKHMHEGEIIKGRIVRIDKDTVLVDVGFKSEGSIAKDEFPERGKELKVGDEIDVFLENTEDNDGLVVLSKEKALKIKIWDELMRAFEENEPVEGEIINRIKGGLTVDVGLKAFLPGSQVDVRPVRNLDKLIGQRFKMKVIKLNRKRGNIVLSRRALLEEERKEARANILASLKEGQELEGVVKNLTDYGAFVDLGGIDGLLHITDMSWGRINHPSEMFSVSDKIKVVVLHYDRENERVSLGHKQTTPDPWTKVAEKFAQGSKIKGKVVSITNYGAFVELEQGVEGLVHISEMSWTKKVKHPSKVVAIGDIVECVVLKVDTEKKRISLGMKHLEPNPWDVVEEKYPVGSEVEGRVRNLTDFGAFIALEEGIDGLIHISDMSWTQRVKHPSEILKKRQKVRCVVLNVDRANERLSLGLKQLQADPWREVPEKYSLGDVAEGEIVKITKFGAFIGLSDGIEGLIHISELSQTRVVNPEDVVKVGDKVRAKIIKIDSESKKLALSIKAYLENSESSRPEPIAPKSEGNLTLGEVLKESGRAPLADSSSFPDKNEDDQVGNDITG